MCGFVGVFNSDFSDVEENRLWVSNCLKQMKYRGPDQSRILVENNTILGFNRLSIRDLSKNGMQPFISSSKKNALVYNGEIYNCDFLIQNSGLSSFNFKSSSDSEVFIEVAEKKGVKWLLEHADGIFAFALINLENQILYLGRDHIGVKPLYIGWNNNSIFFSSEYNHIISHPNFKNNKIQRYALHNYFRYGFIQEGEGLFKNTMFFPQKHFLTCNKNKEFNLEEYKDSKQSVEKNLNKVLENAIYNQLVSDVNIGTFMSGGIDSSLVTNYAHKFKDEIKVITVGVYDSNLDETIQAEEIANKIDKNLDHEVIKLTDEMIINSLNDYNLSLGEPLADFSSLMALNACEIAKKFNCCVERRRRR